MTPGLFERDAAGGSAAVLLSENVAERAVAVGKLHVAIVVDRSLCRRGAKDDCSMSGLKDPEHAAPGPLAGTIVETAVVVEVAKAYWHRGQEPRLWFWCTATGEEVDLFVETVGGIVAMGPGVRALPLRMLWADAGPTRGR